MDLHLYGCCVPAWRAQGQRYHTGCWLCACMVCTATALPYWLLTVCLHGVHRDSSTVLYCTVLYWLPTVCLHGVHRDSSTILAAGCVPAWRAQGQQYRTGCWPCACMVCTGTTVLYWLLTVCLCGVHRDSSTVLYCTGCRLCVCMVCTGTAVPYWLLAVCLHRVHRDSSTLLAAGCVPAWCAQGQQYSTGC